MESAFIDWRSLAAIAEEYGLAQSGKRLPARALTIPQKAMENRGPVRKAGTCQTAAPAEMVSRFGLCHRIGVLCHQHALRTYP